MKATRRQDCKILKEVKRTFSNFRRGNRGKEHRYPPELKQIALSAVQNGASIPQVASAAGVNGRSIRNWRESMGSPSPTELKVVSIRKSKDRLTDGPTDQDGGMVKVAFPSGAAMELSASALSPALILALNGAQT